MGNIFSCCKKTVKEDELLSNNNNNNSENLFNYYDNSKNNNNNKQLKQYEKHIKKITLIQKHIRGRIARKKVKVVMEKEKEEENKGNITIVDINRNNDGEQLNLCCLDEKSEHSTEQLKRLDLTKLKCSDVRENANINRNYNWCFIAQSYGQKEYIFLKQEDAVKIQEQLNNEKKIKGFKITKVPLSYGPDYCSYIDGDKKYTICCNNNCLSSEGEGCIQDTFLSFKHFEQGIERIYDKATRETGNIPNNINVNNQNNNNNINSDEDDLIIIEDGFGSIEIKVDGNPIFFSKEVLEEIKKKLDKDTDFVKIIESFHCPDIDGFTTKKSFYVDRLRKKGDEQQFFFKEDNINCNTFCKDQNSFTIQGTKKNILEKFQNAFNTAYKKNHSTQIKRTLMVIYQKCFSQYIELHEENVLKNNRRFKEEQKKKDLKQSNNKEINKNNIKQQSQQHQNNNDDDNKQLNLYCLDEKSENSKETQECLKVREDAKLNNNYNWCFIKQYSNIKEYIFLKQEDAVKIQEQLKNNDKKEIKGFNIEGASMPPDANIIYCNYIVEDEKEDKKGVIYCDKQNYLSSKKDQETKNTILSFEHFKQGIKRIYDKATAVGASARNTVKLHEQPKQPMSAMKDALGVLKKTNNKLKEDDNEKNKSNKYELKGDVNSLNEGKIDEYNKKIINLNGNNNINDNDDNNNKKAIIEAPEGSIEIKVGGNPIFFSRQVIKQIKEKIISEKNDKKINEENYVFDFEEIFNSFHCPDFDKHRLGQISGDVYINRLKEEKEPQQFRFKEMEKSDLGFCKDENGFVMKAKEKKLFLEAFEEAFRKAYEAEERKNNKNKSLETGLHVVWESINLQLKKMREQEKLKPLNNNAINIYEISSNQAVLDGNP